MRIRGRDWRRVPWKLRYEYGGEAASQLRRMSVRATHRHCRVEFRGHVKIGPGFRLDIPDSGTLIVGEDVEFRDGFFCQILGDGRVEIGDRTVFTSHALIQCSTSITIGPDCNIGQSALIVDGNHRFRDPDKLLSEQGYDFRPITIGAGASVTTKCTVLANVGEKSFVGAHSVVTRDIPAYCLAYGAPARVAEYFGRPEHRPAGLHV